MFGNGKNITRDIIAYCTVGIFKPV